MATKQHFIFLFISSRSPMGARKEKKEENPRKTKSGRKSPQNFLKSSSLAPGATGLAAEGV